MLRKNRGQDTEALGRSHEGFTTKLNAVVSDKFLPLRFILTASACYDDKQASALIGGYACEWVIADTAYDSGPLKSKILAQGGVAVIRPRQSRVQERWYDQDLYKLRNVIERFFIAWYSSVVLPRSMINMQADTSDSSILPLYSSSLKKCKHYLQIHIVSDSNKCIGGIKG